jgi:hypothetical protein
MIDVLRRYVSSNCGIICDRKRMDEAVEIFKSMGSYLLVNYVPRKLETDVLLLGDMDVKTQGRSLKLLENWWRYYDDVKEPAVIPRMLSAKRVVITNPSGTRISFNILGSQTNFDGNDVRVLPYGKLVVPIRKNTIEGRVIVDHSDVAKARTEILFENGRISRISGDMRLSAFLRYGERKSPQNLIIGLNKRARLVEDRRIAMLTHGVVFLEFQDWCLGIFGADMYVDGELVFSEGRFL